MVLIGYIVLLLLICLSISLYIWGLYKSLYWRRKKIASIHAIPFIGNFGKVFTFQKSLAELFHDIYSDIRTKNNPFVSFHILYKPAILVKDPELLRRVLIKDFSVFSNRFASPDEHFDIIGSTSVFFLKNPAWKEVRSRITPFFTGSKLKQMFQLMKSIGTDLNQVMMSENINEQTKTFCIDVKDLFQRYTTDVIASCAFGLKGESLKFPNCDFVTNARRTMKFTYFRALELSCIFFFSEVVPLFRFKVFSKKSNDFVRDSVEYMIRQREESGVGRQDFIDTLITLKNEDKEKVQDSTRNVVFQKDVLIGQAATFFTAGYETSSSTMAFVLYELCWKPEIQKRLRSEVKEVLIKSKGDPNYEEIRDMEYLNMVIQETLRMYPTVPFVDRVCNSDEGYALEPFDDFVIPKGMALIIPIYSIHRDAKMNMTVKNSSKHVGWVAKTAEEKKYFPNPDIFDPERFSVKNKQNITPYTFLPFGIGPRSCIGERFGMMQIKIGLVNFFKNHYVEPSNCTAKVMVFEKKALVLQSQGGVQLNIIRDPLL